MMDDISEQQDVAKEISEAISNPGTNNMASNSFKIKFLLINLT